MNVGEGAADNRIRWMGMEERGTAVKWAIAGVMALMAGGFLGAPAEGSRDEPAEPQVKRAETAKADEPAGKNEEAKGAARKDRLEAARRARELARVRRTLRAKPKPLEFEAMPVADVLKALGEAGRFAIVFDEELEEQGIDLSDRRVTLRAADMTYEDAIYLILPPECGYSARPGYILITTLEKSWLPLRTVVYGVREALAEVPNFKGPRIEFGDLSSRSAAGGGGGLFEETAEEDEESRVTPERLIKMVKRHARRENDRRIAPWDDEGGPASISYLDGKLIISQTYHGHRAVAKLLMAIR